MSSVIATQQMNTVFRIWDRQKEMFWTTPRGKTMWNAAGHAKNSWQYATMKQWGDVPHLVIREYNLSYLREVR